MKGFAEPLELRWQSECQLGTIMEWQNPKSCFAHNKWFARRCSRFMLCRQILFEYLIAQDVGWMARRKVKQSRRAKKVLTIVTARLFPSRCDIRQNVTRKTRAERKKGEKEGPQKWQMERVLIFHVAFVIKSSRSQQLLMRLNEEKIPNLHTQRHRRGGRGDEFDWRAQSSRQTISSNLWSSFTSLTLPPRLVSRNTTGKKWA